MNMQTVQPSIVTSQNIESKSSEPRQAPSEHTDILKPICISTETCCDSTPLQKAANDVDNIHENDLAHSNNLKRNQTTTHIKYISLPAMQTGMQTSGHIKNNGSEYFQREAIHDIDTLAVWFIVPVKDWFLMVRQKYSIEETFTRFYEEYLLNEHTNRLLPELEEDIIIRNPILSSSQFQQLVSLDIRPLPKKSQYKICESNCRVLNEHVATQVYDQEDTNVKNWLNSLDYPDPHHSTVKLLIYHFNHSLNSHRSIDEKFNGISPNQACELYGRLYPDETSRTQAWTKIVHNNYKNLPKLPIRY